MIHRLLIQGPNFLDFLAIPFSTSKILNLNIHPTKKLMGAFSIQPLHYLSAKVRSKMIPFLWRSVFPVFNPNFNFCRNICEFIFFLVFLLSYQLPDRKQTQRHFLAFRVNIWLIETETTWLDCLSFQKDWETDFCTSSSDESQRYLGIPNHIFQEEKVIKVSVNSMIQQFYKQTLIWRVALAPLKKPIFCWLGVTSGGWSANVTPHLFYFCIFFVN